MEEFNKDSTIPSHGEIKSLIEASLGGRGGVCERHSVKTSHSKKHVSSLE